MAEHARFHLKSLDDLAKLASDLGVSVPARTDVSILSTPLALGSARTPNRFAVHPMEGFDSDDQGGPTELSFRRYRRYAAGGYGLIWAEATAVVFEGRSNPRQLWINKENVGRFRDMVSEARKAASEAFGASHRPLMVLQLTHSGRYSKPAGTPAPLIAHHSEVLDPIHKLGPDYPLVTDEYLDKLQDKFVEAAKLAREAGFDGVDVKSCHRYLFAELYASFRRENSRYGGSFENRTRMVRETMARIKAEVPGLFVTTRMNVYDAIPYPWGWGVDKDDYTKVDLSEPLKLIAEFVKMGAPALNCSIANPYYNPHYGRPYDHPIVGMNPPKEHPLEGVARFMAVTRQVQEAYPKLPVLAGGYSWLRHLLPHVAAETLATGGASLLGLGRSSFAYPDAPKDVMTTGKMDPGKCCITCSACTQIMRDGGRTGCVVRDSAIYGEEYRKARRMAPDHLKAEALRCRDCETPTCQAKCPAHVDIPRFIKAFADGDMVRAYEVLRQSNCLPELCAYVCPSEEQCEGGCVEGILTGKPVAIRDIQMAVARAARLSGKAGLKAGPASGRKAAVVGAGPAGLACAARLVELGHEVHIFEAAQGPGGVPSEQIPPERYPGGIAKQEVEAVFAEVMAAGRVKVFYGESLGKNGRSLDSLAKEYDAVFLGMGLGQPSQLPGDRQRPAGVVDSAAFLRLSKHGRLKTPERVAVLGGGNTAMDAACAAARAGAQDVYLVYRRSYNEMPAWPREREEALRLGVHFLLLTQPLGYVAEKGKLAGLRVARTALGEPDASGRRRPRTLPDTECVLPVDMVVEALGQEAPEDLREALPGVELTRQGLVAVKARTFATSRPGVYAGGDLVNGGATAVQAVAEGMAAAAAMDERLRGKPAA
ncbi:MAG TPA: FAD-dependent oxidoreductase [Candidatus Brocadiia bacterium]|nr:FAD-dependent oxidoreductase [Candidatus Brocadiia bacterium]